ncbi:MAG: hypothetical protein KJN64_02495 [Ignavibacteria bacterium]|nr:hypothetical protein [Ignavibacteria bacterium]
MQIIVPDKLSQKGVETFIKLYQEKCGKQLSIEEANKMGLELVEFFATLLEAEIKIIEDGITTIDF